MINKLNSFYYKTLRLALLSVLFIGIETANAQGQRLRLESSPMPVSKIMADIERQTSLRFAFDKRYFDTSVTVSIQPSELSLEEALQQITAGQSVAAVIYKTYITISPVITPHSVATDVHDDMGDIPHIGYTLETPRVPVAVTGGDALKAASEEVKTGPAEENTPDREIAETPLAGSAVAKPVDGRPEITLNSYVVSPDSYFYRELPKWAAKIDLLYGLGTLTPNLSGEIGLGRRTTLELSGSNNRWNRKGDKSDNKKFVHWTVRPEFRYWLCERFNGHFFGVNATYWQYNISGHDLLWMFDKEYRYNGHAVGAGITYGYHHMLSEKWGIEFAAGVGVAFMDHDKFECHYCGDRVKEERKVYFGPTRASISIVYMLK